MSELGETTSQMGAAGARTRNVGLSRDDAFHRAIEESRGELDELAAAHAHFLEMTVEGSGECLNGSVRVRHICILPLPYFDDVSATRIL